MSKLATHTDEYGVVTYWYGDTEVPEQDFRDLEFHFRQTPQNPVVDFELAFQGVNNLENKLLNVVDAAGLPEVQRYALRSLVLDYGYDLKQALLEHKQ